MKQDSVELHALMDAAFEIRDAVKKFRAAYAVVHPERDKERTNEIIRQVAMHDAKLEEEM